MQLSCPQCSAQIPAENINIQQMVAVCPNCDTVFEFNSPRSSKSKIRKVKQPHNLAMQENDTLRMRFRTNFRLDRNQAFLTSGGLALVFTFVTAIISEDMIADGNFTPVIPLPFLLVALAMFYWMALTVFNHTEIEMDDEAITVARKPLPNFLNPNPHVVNLNGVEAIRVAETDASVKEQYDTPRFRIWAEMTDGRQKTIVTDLIEDYAFYVAQHLNERLENPVQSDYVDLSHLMDDETKHEDVLYEDNLPKSSASSR